MIEVTFSGSTHETSAFGLTQWDKGQKLKIIWADAPEKFQVHFSSRDSNEAIVVEASGEAGVAVADIPDELLRVSADIFAWIYLSENENQGESVKRAVLYVRPRPKPQNVLDEIEPTQQEKLEIVLREINESINHMKENGVDAEYIPEYVINEAESIAAKVNDIQNENTLVFMLASDAHFKTGDYVLGNSLKHMSQAMRLISEKCPIDFAAYLGDMTEGGSDKSIGEAKKEFMNVNSLLHPVFSLVPSVRCHGSEDNLHKALYKNGANINADELYAYIERWNADGVFPETEKERGYCYTDLENEKLRVICLNTSDTKGKVLTPTSETAVMSSSQLNWLCSVLDLSGKSDSADWGIVLLGHHPLNMQDKFNVALQIIEKYVAGGSIDVMLADSSTVRYDFAGKNSAEILAQFHGHLHNYRVNFITDAKIPLVAIPNASLYDSNFYSDAKYTNEENTYYAEGETFDKYAGTVNDTAFCVVVLDTKTGAINALHYGAGKDRLIVDGTVSEDKDDNNTGNEGGNTGGDNTGGDNTGGDNTGGDNTGGDNTGGSDEDDPETEYSYTNLVPLSKSASGMSYADGAGYNDNYMLTSANTMYYGKGFTHTGYIDVGADDVIRVSGGTFDGSVGNYILACNSKYEVLFVKNLTGYTDAAAGISYTDSGILVFKPVDVTQADLSNMAYLRVSTKGEGENLIVTSNELIDGSTVQNIAPPMISYTNIMRYAMDIDGNDYGTGGYIDGYKINAEGAEVAAVGFTMTGYFELDINAVIRFKGIIFDGNDGCRMCVYDSNHQLLHNVSVKTSGSVNNGISCQNEVYTFTPAASPTDMSGIAYIRFSGRGSGKTFVITYNEEIN